MTTLTREHLGILDVPPTPDVRRLDELPEIRDQHREALASIPTPNTPEDRL